MWHQSPLTLQEGRVVAEDVVYDLLSLTMILLYTRVYCIFMKTITFQMGVSLGGVLLIVSNNRFDIVCCQKFFWRMESIATALVTNKVKGLTKDLENAVGLNEDDRQNEVK